MILSRTIFGIAIMKKMFDLSLFGKHQYQLIVKSHLLTKVLRRLIKGPELIRSYKYDARVPRALYCSYPHVYLTEHNTYRKTCLK